MLLWLAAGSLAAIAVAFLAATLQDAGWAPIGIISIVVGLTLGGILFALAAMLRFAGTRRIVVGTIALSLLAVLAEHAWLYRDFRRQWHEARAKSPEAAMFRPAEPWSVREYFERELTAQSALLWGVDAALIVVAAAGAVYVLNAKRHEFGLAADANDPKPPATGP